MTPGPSKRERTGAKKSKAHLNLSPLVSKTPGEVRFIPHLKRNKLAVRTS